MYRLISHMATLMTTASFTLAPLFSLGAIAPAQSGAIMATLCSGGVIQIDLGQGGDDPLPQAPHSKACHAVCCQRDPDSDDSAEPDAAPEDS